MDSYVHDFVNYLLYFGLIHPNLISSFENQYNILVTGLNKNNNNIRFKNENKFIFKSKSVSNIQLVKTNKDEMIFQALNNYIMGLTANQIKIISKNILGKFNQYIGNIKNKFLNQLVNIYSKQNLNQYFEKWKKIDNIKIENDNFNNYNDKKSERNINDSIYFKKISNEIKKKFSTFKRDYSNPKKINKSYHTSYNIDKKLKDNKTNNFIARQVEYSKISEIKRELIHNQNEEEIINLCSFSPKLNTISASIKSKYKKIIKNKPFSETKRQISSSKKNNNNNISTKVSERLYNDYSKYQKKRNELTKEIDMERGITFKPKSYTNKSKNYKIEGNFNERNKKLLEDRQNFAFVYDYLRQKEIDENLVSGGKGFNLINNYIIDNKIKNKNIKYEKLLSNSKIDEN